MLKPRHWRLSLKNLKAPCHPLRLAPPASAILFIHFNAQAKPQGDFSLISYATGGVLRTETRIF